eukprot:4005636-Lingulodinium_polyedra.AAC.1
MLQHAQTAANAPRNEKQSQRFAHVATRNPNALRNNVETRSRMLQHAQTAADALRNCGFETRSHQSAHAATRSRALHRCRN